MASEDLGAPGRRGLSGLVSVVDDDTSVLRSLRNLLDSAGLRVETFGSAEAFLASGRLAETACLVLDLRMPGMSGQELFSRIAGDEGRVPMVILTAETSDDERERWLTNGALAFLTKPFRAADILVVVRRALRTNA
jgi:FixJ family two-component response regulator